MSEQLKKELASLEKKKDEIKQIITSANARYEAQMEILNKEFGITKQEEIDPLLNKMEVEMKELQDKAKDGIDKLKKAVEQLGSIVNG